MYSLRSNSRAMRVTCAACLERKTAVMRRPACGACGVARWCPSFGVGPTDEATARKLVKTGPFS
jgi:hypothetical protein